eukprot:365796-Hanusia_phi.AAC.1
MKLLGRWIHPTVTSSFKDKGTARAFHTATYFPNKRTGAARVLMFGGLADGAPLNTVESVELKLSSSQNQSYPHTWHWKQVSTLGIAPIPRFGHSATLCGTEKNKLVIIGGCHGHVLRDFNSNGRELKDVHILDLAADIPTWSELDMRGYIPTHCLGRLHCAVKAGQEILCFGGGAASKMTNDVIAVNVYNKTWRQLEMEGQAPSPRQDSYMVPLEGGTEMLMFGGWNKKALGDCYLLRLGGFRTREYAFSGCNLKPGYDQAEERRREERRLEKERERREREKQEKLKMEREKREKEKVGKKKNKSEGKAAAAAAADSPEATYRKMMNSFIIRSALSQATAAGSQAGGCSCGRCQPNAPVTLEPLDAEEEEQEDAVGVFLLGGVAYKKSQAIERNFSCLPWLLAGSSSATRSGHALP